MDTLTDEEKIQRGSRAYDLMHSGVFDEALDDLRNMLLSSLETLVTDDPEPVMSIMRQLRSIRHLRGKLKTWVSEARTIRIQSGETVD